MSTLVFNNARLLMNGYELSGYANNIGLEYKADMLDVTTFLSGGNRVNKAGLKTVGIKGAGFWDDAMDSVYHARIGATAAVLSVAPEGQAVGDIAYLTTGVNGAYSPVNGGVGEMSQFELDFATAATSAPLVRGRVGMLGSKSASGNGSGVQLGAVSATQRIYAALHVTSAPGTTLDVKVQSDSADTWGSPTDVLTFTQVGISTTGAAEFLSAAGAITDTWWRFVWTVSGSGPYVVFGTFGIL